MPTTLSLLAVCALSAACLTHAAAVDYVDRLCRYSHEPYASGCHAPPSGDAELFLLLLGLDIATWPIQEALDGREFTRSASDLNLDVERADPLCAQLHAGGSDFFVFESSAADDSRRR